MRILITSGGTKVPVDPVRYLTNMSKGTFGSKIAVEALDQGHKVEYFVSYEGVKPFDFKYSFYDPNDPLIIGSDLYNCNVKVRNHFDWCAKNRENYQQSHYSTYDDYKEFLPFIIKGYMPDVVILVAAVSDYVTVAKDSKIKSDKDMVIELQKAEKIISTIKKQFPHVFLVGFKLVVDQTQQQLVDACWKSIEENGCDLVVGNDLRDIKANKHSVTLVKRGADGNPQVDVFTENLAQHVIDFATQKGM